MQRFRPLLIACLAVATLAPRAATAQARSATDAAEPGLTGITPSPASSLTSRDYLGTPGSWDYLVQPGDIYALYLIFYDQADRGAQTMQVDVILEDDYTIMFPIASVIEARDATFGELRRIAMKRFRESASVLHVDLRLKIPATFDVFVTGAVVQAGYISANGFMRVSDAVEVAGGSLEGASLRRISLQRGGTSRSADLLRFATGRDPDSNPLLRAGDVISVPVALSGVRIVGKTQNAGLYEIEPGESLADLLELAGGPASAGLDRIAYVTRPEGSGAYSIIGVEQKDMPAFLLQEGDTVTVPSAPTPAMVTVEGALMGPTTPSTKGSPDPAATETLAVPTSPLYLQVAYSPGLTLLTLLDQLRGPAPNSDASKSYVVRAADGSRVSVDVAALWRTRDPVTDVPIQPGDRVVVPAITRTVAVRGEVVSARTYAYVAGQTAADYIRDAGGPTAAGGVGSRIWVTPHGGSRHRVQETYEPVPGDTLEVGRTGAAAVSQFFTRYVFPITGVVGSLAAVATAVIELIVYAEDNLK